MMLHLLPPTTTYVKCELAKGRRTAIGSFRTMLHLLLPPIAMAGIAFIISRQDLSQSQHNPTETPRKHLQKVALATESVSTQLRKPANKGSNDVQEASKVTPTKYLKNSSCDGVDSGLSSDIMIPALPLPTSQLMLLLMKGNLPSRPLLVAPTISPFKM
jgi:hypothetical protein